MRATTRRGLPFALAGLAASVAVAVPLATAPSASAAEPVVVADHTFENGNTHGWAPRADETVVASTAVAHGGTGSLLASGRTRTWEGPTLDLLDTMDKGVRYTISVWVRLAAGSGASQARLSVERRTAGTPSYDQVVGNTNVSDGGWVNLQGQYTLAHDVEWLAVYVETASGTASLHIDDFTLSYVPATPIQTDIPSVKDVLADHFPIGAAISVPQTLGEHARLLSKHFNSVTPGNALKWDATEPTEGTFRFADADAMVDFAQANGMEVRGHTLVWHNQTPAWVFLDANGAAMTPTAANKALLLSRLEAHIRAVVGHYGTDIATWDVVNEVIDEGQADGLRRSRWYEIAGLDYIRTAFRVTREVAPTAKLYVNDYNTNVPAKRDKLYNLVSQLKAEGVPIDGVGHQMHVNVDWPSVSESEAMIQKFVPLGVDQQVTEMDVSIYTNTGESFPTPPRDRLIRQAYKYRDLFDLYKRYSSELTSVTVWGLADDDTWLDTFPVVRNDAPLLFDDQLQAKPAYWGIVDPTRIETTASATTPTAAPTTATPTSAPPPTTPPPTAGSCQVTYRIVGQWAGGFQGEVRIAPGRASTAWTVRWTFPNGQQINQGWSGTFTQSGANVTVTNAAWNGSVPAGGAVTIGFIASWSGTNGLPTSFTVNDSACLA
jgi:endo-1,4-beta-xylanase